LILVIQIPMLLFPVQLMGAPSMAILLSASDLSGLDIESTDLTLPHFSTYQLVGLTFIHNIKDASKHRATVAKKIVDINAANHQKIKFLV
jgi:hypothetical protein